MTFFLVYDNVLGTATARPILRWGECDTTEISAQAIDANDVVVTVSDLAAFDDVTDDEFEITAANYYIYNTSTLTISAVTKTNNIDYIAERVKSRAAMLLADTVWTQTVEGALTDPAFADWRTYRKELRDIHLQAGFPTSIVWPTPPSAAESGDPIWTRIYRRGNILGTVSQGLLGTPTGALIERGSNANGSYVRFADGLQICTQTVSSATYNITTATGNIFTTSGEATWTFPAAFATADNLSVTGNIRNTAAIWVKARASAASTAAVRLMASTSISPSANVELTAIGSWV